MTTEKTNQKKDSTPQKEGFFNRIFTKIDNSMKVKADEAAKNQCCSEDKDSKGGKVLLKQDPAPSL
jgi:hypothetical protein